MTKINDYTFDRCTSLYSVIIPNSVTSIGQSAFGYCNSLTSVTIPNSVRSISMDAFQHCENLTSVTIPNSVIWIYAYAFNHCTSLISISIPNSVKSIDAFTFTDCSSLTSISIGNSVTNIEREAFARCLGLMDFYCLSENVPSTSSSAFKGTSIENTTLHVPANSVNKYKSREPWKNFKNIVPLDDQSIENIEYTTPSSRIDIYSYNGKLIGTAVGQEEADDIVNNLPSGTIVIVKKGEKSDKVIVK